MNGSPSWRNRLKLHTGHRLHRLGSPPNLVITRDLPGRPRSGSFVSQESGSKSLAKRPLSIVDGEKDSKKEKPRLSRSATNSIGRDKVPLNRPSGRLIGVTPSSARRESSLAQASPSGIDVGALVEYHCGDTKRRLGRVVEFLPPRKWKLLDSSGAEAIIPHWKISFLVARALDAIRINGSLVALERVCSKLANEKRRCLEDLWREMQASVATSSVSTENLAVYMFQCNSPVHVYVAHMLLSADKLYFKARERQTTADFYDPGQYYAKTSKDVIKSKRVITDSMKWNALNESVSNKSLAQASAVLPKESLSALISSLKLIAMDLERDNTGAVAYVSECNGTYENMEETNQILVSELMTALGKSICPSSAFEVLVAWQIFSKHENMAVLKAKLTPSAADEKVIIASEKLRTARVVDADKAHRTDYSSLRAIAIDREGTKDIDDAVSYSNVKGGGRVYVHIADPTRYFPRGPHDPLIALAFRRAETLYLPHDRLTMFPDRLASERFSLSGKNSDRTALTISFTVAKDGSIGESTNISSSYISRPTCLSFNKAQRIIEKGDGSVASDLRALLKVAERRKRFRLSQKGARITNDMSGQVTVSNYRSSNPSISISKSSENDETAKELVAELMMTANIIAATFARDNAIPVPFRGRTNSVVTTCPRRKTTVPPICSPRGAQHSELSLVAVHNHSVGVPAYMTITSPIRKSSDLLSHFQIKAFLRKQKSLPFSTNDVKSHIVSLSEIMAKHRRVLARTDKYWKLEYLRQAGPGAVHNGIFLRRTSHDEGQAVVRFTQIGMDVEIALPDGFDTSRPVTASVKNVNPRTFEVFFAAFEEPPKKRRKM